MPLRENADFHVIFEHWSLKLNQYIHTGKAVTISSSLLLRNIEQIHLLMVTE